MDDDLGQVADSIIDQLQQSFTTKPKQVEEGIHLSPEDLAQFVINKSATLVMQSMDAVDSLKDYVQQGASDKEISAFAELVKSSSQALESLNKLLQTREKINNTVEMKKMDIEARKQLNIQDNSTRLLLSREDLMQKLIEDSQQIIDITPVAD